MCSFLATISHETGEKMKKRVLITTESLKTGGVETALLALLKELKKCDVTVDLYVVEKGELLEEFENLTSVQVIDSGIPKNKILYRIFKTLRCKGLYRRYQKQHQKEYDAAIAFYGINNYADMFVAAARAKKKYIWVHTNYHSIVEISRHKWILKMRNKIMGKKFSCFDEVIPVSESAKKGFLQEFPSYQNVHVINNLIGIERFAHKKDACEMDGIKSNKLLYVGRIDSTKNVEGLILEFEKVLEELPDSILYICGDGPLKSDMVALAESKNLKKKVVFLGRQSNPFKYMDRCDIFVTASLHEANSITNLEVLALKKYYVSANNEGAEDIFYLNNHGDKNNGIVCAPEEMHQHIIYYLKNKKKFKPNFDISSFNQKNLKEILALFGITN